MGLFFYSFLALANSNKTGIARPLFGRFVANVVREKETCGLSFLQFYSALQQTLLLNQAKVMLVSRGILATTKHTCD